MKRKFALSLLIGSGLVACVYTTSDSAPTPTLAFETFGASEMAIQHASADAPGSDSPKMVAASRVTYITSDNPPFLIIHSAQDQWTPLENPKY